MRKVRRIQRAPAPIPDFQVDAAEDIKSETRGILRDLLLALAKVRGTGLGGRELPHWGGPSCGVMSRRGLWGETKVWFVGLVIKNCPPKSPPESFSSQGGREAYTGIIDYNLAAQDVQVSKGWGSVHRRAHKTRYLRAGDLCALLSC